VTSDHAVDDTVTLLPTPGHTIDHYAVALGRGGKDAVVTGDLIHSPLQARYPDLGMYVDYDVKQGAATRRKFLETYCDTSTLCCFAHFPSPSRGYVKRWGDGFCCDYVDNCPGVRLLAWNIRQGGGTRLVGIMAAIMRHDADVLVLSEYRGGDSAIRLRTALAALGYRMVTELVPPPQCTGVLIAAKRRFLEHGAFCVEVEEPYRLVDVDLGAVRLTGV